MRGFRVKRVSPLPTRQICVRPDQVLVPSLVGTTGNRSAAISVSLDQWLIGARSAAWALALASISYHSCCRTSGWRWIQYRAQLRAWAVVSWPATSKGISSSWSS